MSVRYRLICRWCNGSGSHRWDPTAPCDACRGRGLLPK